MEYADNFDPDKHDILVMDGAYYKSVHGYCNSCVFDKNKTKCLEAPCGDLGRIFKEVHYVSN
jgi:hypothetical protein